MQSLRPSAIRTSWCAVSRGPSSSWARTQMELLRSLRQTRKSVSRVATRKSGSRLPPSTPASRARDVDVPPTSSQQRVGLA